MRKDNSLYVQVLEQALSHLGQGIILLSTSGEMLFMTDVAQDMIDKNDGLAIVESKLIALQAQDNQRLQSMLMNVVEDTSSEYKYFYIHRKDSVRPYWLMVSKLVVLHGETAPNDESLLIVIKDVQANNSHWQERLKSTYKLTNREASFVVLLTEGRNIKEIGLVMGIAEDTTRQYLKNCFKKMDVNKQHELVCLALDCFRNR